MIQGASIYRPIQEVYPVWYLFFPFQYLGMHIIQNYMTYHDTHLRYWYFNDIYHDTTGHKLNELPTVYQKIV